MCGLVLLQCPKCLRFQEDEEDCHKCGAPFESLEHTKIRYVIDEANESDDLRAENARLREELEQLRNQHAMTVENFDLYAEGRVEERASRVKELAAAEAKLARVVEALKFYGDAQKYNTRIPASDPFHRGSIPVMVDCGDEARAALSAIKDTTDAGQ